MKKQKKVVVGYVRTATMPQANKSDFVNDSLSVETQEEQITKYCKAKGYKLTKVFSDNGHSGANLKRPGLQVLLAEASAGKIAKVICLDLSRLSRKTADYLLLKSLLKKYGVEIVTISGVNVSDDCVLQMAKGMMAALDDIYFKANRLRRSRSSKGK